MVAPTRTHALRDLLPADPSRRWQLYGVLSGLPWDEKLALAALGRPYAELVGASGGQAFWAWACGALARERGLFLTPKAHVAGWKQVFFDLWSLGKPRSLQIHVAARFRPPGAHAPVVAAKTQALPLYQRVKAIRAKHQCSKQEALRLLMLEQGHSEAALDADPWSNNHCANKENLAQNAAPAPKREDQGARPSVVSIQEQQVLAIAPGSGLRAFHFERVFAPSTQQEVYDTTSCRLVADFLNGQSACVILYGQTGAGKTHTAFGTASDPGIVVRACDDALQGMQQLGASQLLLSYVELYGNEITDLLKGAVVGQDLEGRYSAVRATDRVGHRYVLDGHTSVQVDGLEHLQELLAQGEAKKRKASTAMNDRSTRAHTVVTLTLQRPGQADSRFFIADLGGSEKLSKSAAGDAVRAPVVVIGGEEAERITWHEYYAYRKRVEETLNINQGLFALKKVVRALHAREQAHADGLRPPYVPYQDSKLTMLLQEGLGGRAQTAIVVCASREDDHAVETIQSLRFGEVCACLAGEAEVSEDALRQAVVDLDARIAELEALIAAKERWEEKRVKRKDERHGADTALVKQELLEQGRVNEAAHVAAEAMAGEEEIVTSVLVGAEQERAELEKVLRQRRELVGDAEGLKQQQRGHWQVQQDAWHGKMQKQVLLPHEKKLEPRFTASGLREGPRDDGTSLLGDALDFVFRKTPYARAEAFDEAKFAKLAAALELSEPRKELLAWVKGDLAQRDAALKALVARAEDPDEI